MYIQAEKKPLINLELPYPPLRIHNNIGGLVEVTTERDRERESNIV